MAQNDDTYKNPENSPVLPNKFDRRVRLRSLTRGDITHKDVEAHLKSLPDDAANAEFRDYDQLVSQEGHDSGAMTTSSEPSVGRLTTH